MKNLYLNALVLALCLITSNLYSATYYVSSSGTSSASGTITNPLNFSAAIRKSLAAGDTIYVRGGTYSFTSTQTISRSGTSTSYIVITAYPGETPVLDFRNQAYNSSNPGVKINSDYLHFKGFIIQGAGDNGLIVYGSNNIIEHCTFRWNCDSGLQMKTGSDNLIKNCDSYENFDYMTTKSDGTPNYGGNADGFADKQYTNTGANTYLGCRSWLNGDDGWDSYQKIGNTVYDSCWCYKNGPDSIDMTNHIRFQTDSASWFYQFKGTDGRFVMKNYGNGNGFKVGGDQTTNNATLRFCVSAGNAVKGFDQNNNAGLMTLYNCSAYKNNPNYGFANTSVGTLIIKNCASLDPLSSNVFKISAITSEHNSWDIGYTCNASYFENLDATQLIANRQADGSLPEITFMHQQSTSGMIDKGLDVGLFYWGTAPDLGAFEYNPSTTAIHENTTFSGVFSAYFLSTGKQIIINASLESSIEIFTIPGRKILSTNVSSGQTELSSEGWSKGLYIIKAIDLNRNIRSAKIMVY